MDGQDNLPISSDHQDPYSVFFNPPSGTRFNPVSIPSSSAQGLIPNPLEPPEWNPAWDDLPSYTQSHNLYTDFGCIQNQDQYQHQLFPPTFPPDIKVRPKPKKLLCTQHIPNLLSVEITKEDISSSASHRNKAGEILKKQRIGAIVESTAGTASILVVSGKVAVGSDENPASTPEGAYESNLHSEIAAESDNQHRRDDGDRKNANVSGDVDDVQKEKCKRNEGQLTRSVHDDFVTDTHQTETDQSNQESLIEGHNMAEMNNLPISSTFRKRSNSGSSDRTEIINRDSNGSVPRRSSNGTRLPEGGDALRFTRLGSFNKVAKLIKREVIHGSDLEGNQSIRGSRSLEAVVAPEQMNSQPQSSAEASIRAKLSSTVKSILAKAKRPTRPNPGGQGPGAEQPTVANQSSQAEPNTRSADGRGAPARKISLDEYKRRAGVPQSQAGAGTSNSANVSAIVSEDPRTKTQKTVPDSSLFTRRSSSEQPAEVSPPASKLPKLSIPESRSKSQFGASETELYVRRPRVAVQEANVTPSTSVLRISPKADAATSDRSNANTSPSKNFASVTSTVPSSEVSDGRDGQFSAEKAVEVRKPCQLASANNVTSQEIGAITTNGTSGSENVITETEFVDPRTRGRRKLITAQDSSKMPSSGEYRSAEHNQEVRSRTSENNKENMDTTLELAGLDFWYELLAEESSKLRIPKALISSDEIRRDIEAADLGNGLSLEEDAPSKEALVQVTVVSRDNLPATLNHDDDIFTEDQVSEAPELNETGEDMLPKAILIDNHLNANLDKSESSKPQQTQEHLSGVAAKDTDMLSTEVITEEMDTEPPLPSSRLVDNATVNPLGNVAVVQDLELETFEDSPESLKTGKEANRKIEDTIPSVIEIKNKETKESLSAESEEIGSGTLKMSANDETAKIQPHHADATSPTEVSAKNADDSSSSKPGNESTSSAKSPTRNEIIAASDSDIPQLVSGGTSVTDTSVEKASAQVSEETPVNLAAKLKSYLKNKPSLPSASSRSSKRPVSEDASQVHKEPKRKHINSDKSATAVVSTQSTGGDTESVHSLAAANGSTQTPQVNEDHSLSSMSIATVISNTIDNASLVLQSKSNGKSTGSSSSGNDYSNMTLSDILRDSDSVSESYTATSTSASDSDMAAVTDQSSVVTPPEAPVRVCKEVQCELWSKSNICSKLQNTTQTPKPAHKPIPSCYKPEECFFPENQERYRLQKNKLVNECKGQLNWLSEKLEQFQKETSETDPEGLLTGMTKLRHDVITFANLVDVNIIQFEQMRSKTPREVLEISLVNCERIPMNSMPGYLEILLTYDTYSRIEEFKNHPDFRHVELYRYRALRALKYLCKDNEEGSLLNVHRTLAKTHKGWSFEQLTRCWDSVKQFRGEVDTEAIEAEFNSNSDKTMIRPIGALISKIKKDLASKKPGPAVTHSPSPSVPIGNVSAVLRTGTTMPSTSTSAHFGAHAGTQAHIVHHPVSGLGTQFAGIPAVAQFPINLSKVPEQAGSRIGQQATSQTVGATRSRSRKQHSSTTLSHPKSTRVHSASNYPTLRGGAQLSPAVVPQVQGLSGYNPLVRAALRQNVTSRSPSPSIAQQFNIPSDVSVTRVQSVGQQHHQQHAGFAYSSSTILHQQQQQQQQMQRNAVSHQFHAQNSQLQTNAGSGHIPLSYPVSVISANTAPQVHRGGLGYYVENDQLPTNQAPSGVNGQVVVDRLIESYFQDPSQSS